MINPRHRAARLQTWCGRLVAVKTSLQRTRYDACAITHLAKKEGATFKDLLQIIKVIVWPLFIATWTAYVIVILNYNKSVHHLMPVVSQGHANFTGVDCKVELITQVHHFHCKARTIYSLMFIKNTVSFIVAFIFFNSLLSTGEGRTD